MAAKSYQQNNTFKKLDDRYEAWKNQPTVNTNFMLAKNSNV